MALRRLFITMSCEANMLQTLPVFVLLFLVEIATYPVVIRGNGTLLERPQSLLSRSITGKSGEKSDVNWESDYLVGIKRQRLYYNVGIRFHLKIQDESKISRVYNLFEISTVERDVVSLFDVKSILFIAMNNKGKLYVTKNTSAKIFQALTKITKLATQLLLNNYNAYETNAYHGSYTALSKHRRVKRGNKVSPSMTVHFLPGIQT
ncbi:LOW QUALITY PROTEIN: fibroblast growth factor 6 [Eudromia elegans]